MRIDIQAPWEVNPYLEGIINERLTKLEKFNQRIMHADVFLKIGDHVGEANKSAEVRLRTGQGAFFAQAHAESFEKAVSSSAEKLRTQLIKKKEQMQ